MTTTTNNNATNTASTNAIVYSVERKFSDVEYLMNELTDNMFEGMGRSQFDEGECLVQQHVMLKASSDQFPEGFIKAPRRFDRGYFRDIADSKVQFRVTLDVSDGVNFLVTFSHRESYGRKKSESSIQAIKDSVNAEFDKHNYVELTKSIVTDEIMKMVVEKNSELVSRAEYFFENNAAKHADDLLTEDNNREFLFLSEQAETLKKMLKDIEVQQSKLRKDRLIEECNKDDREIPDVIKPLFQKSLFDAVGIVKKSLFRR